MPRNDSLFYFFSEKMRLEQAAKGRCPAWGGLLSAREFCGGLPGDAIFRPSVEVVDLAAVPFFDYTAAKF